MAGWGHSRDLMGWLGAASSGLGGSTWVLCLVLTGGPSLLGTTFVLMPKLLPKFWCRSALPPVVSFIPPASFDADSSI